MNTEILTLGKKYGISLKNNIQINDLGLDFRAAFVEDTQEKKWLFRIPRRTNLLSQIKHEANILNFLKSKLSCKIPNWVVAESDLVAYPLLTDSPALEVEPSTFKLTWNIDQQSTKFSESLAFFLYELHRISTEDATKAGLKFKSSEQVRSSLIEDIKHVKSELGVSQTRETKWKAWIDDDTYWPSFSTVIHGDLYAGHTLVDSNDNVTGIIDWSEAQVSDPSIDFLGHYTGFGEEGLNHLLSTYEKLGGKVWNRMKEHIVEGSSAAPLKFGVFALKTQNPDHLKEAKRQLNE